MSPPVRLRPATAGDAVVPAAMLAEAAAWRPEEEPRPAGEVAADPALGRYVTDFGRQGDVGLVAEAWDEAPVGAAWCRCLPADAPGYGFVAADVPELSIGVVPGWRGRGIGGRLLSALLAAAREAGCHAVSLSVEESNPARRLYRRHGVDEIARTASAVTMWARTGPARSP
jgi:GNAT superfamily N-acetyltransferase